MFAFRVVVATAVVVAAILLATISSFYISYRSLPISDTTVVPHTQLVASTPPAYPDLLPAARRAADTNGTIVFTDQSNRSIVRVVPTVDVQTATQSGVSIMVATPAGGETEMIRIDTVCVLGGALSIAGQLHVSGGFTAAASLQQMLPLNVSGINTGHVNGPYVASPRGVYDAGMDRNGALYPAVYTHGSLLLDDGGNAVVRAGGDVLVNYLNLTDGTRRTASLLQDHASLQAFLATTNITDAQLAALDVPLWEYLGRLQPQITLADAMAWSSVNAPTGFDATNTTVDGDLIATHLSLPASLGNLVLLCAANGVFAQTGACPAGTVAVGVDSQYVWCVYGQFTPCAPVCSPQTPCRNGGFCWNGICECSYPYDGPLCEAVYTCPSNTLYTPKLGRCATPCPGTNDACGAPGSGCPPCDTSAGYACINNACTPCNGTDTSCFPIPDGTGCSVCTTQGAQISHCLPDSSPLLLYNDQLAPGCYAGGIGGDNIVVGPEYWWYGPPYQALVASAGDRWVACDLSTPPGYGTVSIAPYYNGINNAYCDHPQNALGGTWTFCPFPGMRSNEDLTCCIRPCPINMDIVASEAWGEQAACFCPTTGQTTALYRGQQYCNAPHGEYTDFVACPPTCNGTAQACYYNMTSFLCQQCPAGQYCVPQDSPLVKQAGLTGGCYPSTGVSPPGVLEGPRYATTGNILIGAVSTAAALAGSTWVECDTNTPQGWMPYMWYCTNIRPIVGGVWTPTLATTAAPFMVRSLDNMACLVPACPANMLNWVQAPVNWLWCSCPAVDKYYDIGITGLPYRMPCGQTPGVNYTLCPQACLGNTASCGVPGQCTQCPQFTMIFPAGYGTIVGSDSQISPLDSLGGFYVYTTPTVSCTIAFTSCSTLGDQDWCGSADFLYYIPPLAYQLQVTVPVRQACTGSGLAEACGPTPATCAVAMCKLAQMMSVTETPSEPVTPEIVQYTGGDIANWQSLVPSECLAGAITVTTPFDGANMGCNGWLSQADTTFGGKSMGFAIQNTAVSDPSLCLQSCPPGTGVVPQQSPLVTTARVLPGCGPLPYWYWSTAFNGNVQGFLYNGILTMCYATLAPWAGMPAVYCANANDQYGGQWVACPGNLMTDPEDITQCTCAQGTYKIPSQSPLVSVEGLAVQCVPSGYTYASQGLNANAGVFLRPSSAPTYVVACDAAVAPWAGMPPAYCNGASNQWGGYWVACQQNYITDPSNIAQCICGGAAVPAGSPLVTIDGVGPTACGPNPYWYWSTALGGDTTAVNNNGVYMACYAGEPVPPGITKFYCANAGGQYGGNWAACPEGQTTDPTDITQCVCPPGQYVVPTGSPLATVYGFTSTCTPSTTTYSAQALGANANVYVRGTPPNQYVVACDTAIAPWAGMPPAYCNGASNQWGGYWAACDTNYITDPSNIGQCICGGAAVPAGSPLVTIEDVSPTTCGPNPYWYYAHGLGGNTVAFINNGVYMACYTGMSLPSWGTHASCPGASGQYGGTWARCPSNLVTDPEYITQCMCTASTYKIPTQSPLVAAEGLTSQCVPSSYTYLSQGLNANANVFVRGTAPNQWVVACDAAVAPWAGMPPAYCSGASNQWGGYWAACDTNYITDPSNIAQCICSGGFVPAQSPLVTVEGMTASACVSPSLTYYSSALSSNAQVFMRGTAPNQWVIACDASLSPWAGMPPAYCEGASGPWGGYWATCPAGQFTDPADITQCICPPGTYLVPNGSPLLTVEGLTTTCVTGSETYHSAGLGANAQVFVRGTAPNQYVVACDTAVAPWTGMPPAYCNGASNQWGGYWAACDTNYITDPSNIGQCICSGAAVPAGSPLVTIDSVTPTECGPNPYWYWSTAMGGDTTAVNNNGVYMACYTGTPLLTTSQTVYCAGGDGQYGGYWAACPAGQFSNPQNNANCVILCESGQVAAQPNSPVTSSGVLAIGCYDQTTIHQMSYSSAALQANAQVWIRGTAPNLYAILCDTSIGPWAGINPTAYCQGGANQFGGQWQTCEDAVSANLQCCGAVC